MVFFSTKDFETINKKGNFMKILLIALFSIFPIIATAQILIPLDQWERNTPKWNKDLTEVVYVAARCASINHTVGYYISQEGNKSEDIELGKKFIEVGNTFTTVSHEIGINLGMSDKFIYDRHEALTKVYVKKMVENKKMLNQMFAGDFGIDFNFCVSQHPLFKGIADGLSAGKVKK
jgi:hypothetical protein